MSSYVPGDTVYLEFGVTNIAGSPANTDATPSMVLRRNGNTDTGVAVATVGLSGVVGGYRASFKIPSTYARGDTISLSFQGSVLGTTLPFKSLFCVILDSKRIGDLNDSPYLGTDTSGVTTLLNRMSQPIIFDTSGNVNAHVKYNDDKSGYNAANFVAAPSLSSIDSYLITQHGTGSWQQGLISVPDNSATLAAIKAKTDQIVFVGSGINTNISSIPPNWYLAPDNNALSGVKAKTDQLTFSGGLLGIVANAPVWYISPDNAAISGIKAQTDQLGFSGGLLKVNFPGDYVRTGSAPAWYLAPNNDGIAAIKLKTDFLSFGNSGININFDYPAVSGWVFSRMAAFTYTPPDNTEIAAIKSQTDKLIFSGGLLNVNLPNDYVRNNVAPVWYTSLGMTSQDQTAISGWIFSRMASFTYTPPDNADIAFIKAQTDRLGFSGGLLNVNSPVDYARNNLAPSWYAPSGLSLQDQATLSGWIFSRLATSDYIVPPSDYAKTSMAPSWYSPIDMSGIKGELDQIIQMIQNTSVPVAITNVLNALSDLQTKINTIPNNSQVAGMIRTLGNLHIENAPRR